MRWIRASILQAIEKRIEISNQLLLRPTDILMPIVDHDAVYIELLEHPVFVACRRNVDEIERSALQENRESQNGNKGADRQQEQERADFFSDRH